MGKKLALTIAAATLAGAPVAAFAETIVDKGAHVAIDVPDKWTSTTKGDMILLSDAKGDVAVSFVLVDAGAIKAASKAVGKYLGTTVNKLVLKPEKPVNLGGMTGIAIDGDGFLGDVNIDLTVMVVDTPATDKDLLILAIAEDAKLARHKDEIMYVFQHIHPTKQ